jgi:signal transduction histidine kinase
MDLSPAAGIVTSLAPRLGLVQASFFLRTRGAAGFVQYPLLGAVDDGASGRSALPTWQTDATPDNGVGTLNGPEALLSFRTCQADDIGLYLRLAAPPDDDRRDLLRHLRLVLSRLFEEQARARAFAGDMESTMRILTHDLKSPTNAVAGFVDILFEDFGSVLPEGVNELLQRIRSSAARLQILLDGVYRLRVATFGPLKPARVDLAEVVRDALRRVRERHAGVPCDVLVAEGLPTVFADAEKLDLALGAFFDNAFKFRERSRTLRLEVRYASLGPGRHSLVVSDNSLGFEPRFLDAVFEPFRKLHPPSEYPGAGVGLTVARVVLARHGGEVRLETSPSEGVRAVLVFAEPEPPLAPLAPRA